MNYEKKRNRQKGRQKGIESERQMIYRKGFFDGQAQVIDRMIEAGILPPVNFAPMKSVTKEEFASDYPNNDE